MQGFSYQIMMNKLYSRIKLVDKMFKREIAKLAIESLKRVAPTKLSEE